MIKMQTDWQQKSDNGDYNSNVILIN